jgi:Flp pilus assembly pilin Flp
MQAFSLMLRRLICDVEGATAVEIGIIATVVATTALATVHPQTILKHLPGFSHFRAAFTTADQSSED